MDESLARLALFNVSGMGVITSNKYSVNYDCFPSAISGNPHGRLQPRSVHPHDLLGRQLHHTTPPQGCWITRYGSVQSIWFFQDLVTMVCSQETKHYWRHLRVLYLSMLYCVATSKSYCIFRPPLGDVPQPRHCRQHGRPHRRILPHRQQLKQLDLVKKRWETNRIRCQWIIDSNRQVHLIQGYSTKFCTFPP